MQNSIYQYAETSGRLGMSVFRKYSRWIGTQRLTAEASSAGAHVAAGHVLTGTSIHTRVGQTLVDVDVAVASRPAGLAHASVAVDLVQAVSVNTGVAGALVVLREAGGVSKTLRTEAGVGVDPVDAGATVMTGVYRTVVNVDVTHWACEEKQYVLK